MSASLVERLRVEARVWDDSATRLEGAYERAPPGAAIKRARAALLREAADYVDRLENALLRRTE